jgi:hypothetical protein
LTSELSKGDGMPSVRRRQRRDGARYTALYRDPSGVQRSARTFDSRRAAERAGRRAEGRVEAGSWIDRAAGRITFRDYVEKVWWPSRHLEVSTKAGYRANLDKHFLPYLGEMPMADILPSTVQGWVTKAVNDGLSARSVVKYHVMLHGVFKRALRDRVIAHNPCADTELPKVVAPQEFDPHPRRVRPAARRDPAAMGSAGADRHRDRVALGRAHRAAAAACGLPSPHDLRRGDHRRGVEKAFPDRRADGGQAVPEG